MNNMEEVVAKLKDEFGTDFKYNVGINADDDDDTKKLYVLVNDRYRVVSAISEEEWLTDFDKSLEEFRAIYDFMNGNE